MAINLLEQYGIKEVADVTLYDVVTSKPVLFLDTLKVSTIETTGDQSKASGGKGNPALMIWDFGKEITVTLEDALFTPRSMAILFGDKDKVAGLSSSTITVTQMKRYDTDYIAPSGATIVYYNNAMVSTTTTADYAYAEYTYTTATGVVIDINANSFPGVYRLVGDTYARNRSGVDEYFQFIIPQAKVSPENTITLEAEGDPTVFNMTMRVLRPTTGEMMKLIKYSLA